MRKHAYSVWVTIKPFRTAKGQWVGHCLDFDVVSQGNSPDEALKMTMEATEMVVADDLDASRDPLERRAPERYFASLASIISTGQKVPLDLAMSDRSGARIYALSLQLTMQRLASSKTKKGRGPGLSKPTADVAFAHKVA
jgi:predicted RNase H-like HicB family nuclease